LNNTKVEKLHIAGLWRCAVAAVTAIGMIGCNAGSIKEALCPFVWNATA